MSGDVTAAIERLRALFADAPFQAPIAQVLADVLTLLAEVERLRAEVEVAREQHQETITAAAEVVDTNERLRAEREALHSDETRTKIRQSVQGVLWNASNYPPPVQAHVLGQDVTPLTRHVVDAVLSVLPASSEADQ